ncbi:Crp/Fnr family transcriptional regulator [Actinomadura rubrisoli]|uniref:Crp/Fnr family transcriptional regulator n=1 Tax=Actinomadura rubrisoli TaxID=2530368 RepID=A0A4R5BIJ9_9ACTN|nr:Crp/Fnr family transcriptional regulator [Actinomadura rubrisoli]
MGVVQSYPAQHVLLRQGDRGETVHVLLKGVVKVSAVAENGTETLLGRRVCGDIVGEMAVFLDTERTATVVTCGPVVTEMINGSEFRRYVETHAEAGVALYQMSGDRLLSSVQRRLESAGNDVPTRVARALRDIAQQDLSSGAARSGIEVRMTQAELAAQVSAKEGTVQKALRELEAKGMVRRGRGRVMIVDSAGLRNLTGDRSAPMVGEGRR